MITNSSVEEFQPDKIYKAQYWSNEKLLFEAFFPGNTSIPVPNFQLDYESSEITLVVEEAHIPPKYTAYLNELADKIHNQAVASGFHDSPRRLPEILMLASSELGEAFDAWRDYVGGKARNDNGFNGQNSWTVEVIDCIIVCLDILAMYRVDVDDLMQKKLEFNKTRPYRHGRGI